MTPNFSAWSDSDGWFSKQVNPGTGKMRWFVITPNTEENFIGDMVMIESSRGPRLVRLDAVVPYKGENDKTRWAFTTMDADGREIDRKPYVRDVHEELAADGQPSWVSRKDDGSVKWPQAGEIWRRREDGALGLVDRDLMTSKRAGWYALDALSSKWMFTPVMIREYEFVASSIHEMGGAVVQRVVAERRLWLGDEVSS